MQFLISPVVCFAGVDILCAVKTRKKMTTKADILELVEKLLVIENETKLLQQDRKELLTEYKDKIDIKAFNAALRIAKIKSKLSEGSDAELDNILETVESKITIDWVD